MKIRELDTEMLIVILDQDMLTQCKLLRSLIIANNIPLEDPIVAFWVDATSAQIPESNEEYTNWHNKLNEFSEVFKLLIGE